MTDFIFNIQMFADAGAVVNATQNITNAYLGTETPRTNANTMDPTLKEFYDTELLENARVETYYAQFAKKVRLPKGHKGVIEFRKWNRFQPAQQLKEAVIPAGQEFGQTNLTGTVNQYGTYTTISDILELQSYDDVIAGATEEMGASAAETQETLIRNGLLAGKNVLYADNVNGSTVTTPTGPNQMGASTANGWAKLTAKTVNKAVTIMKKNRAPRINGKYYAVVHPSVAHDLREDPEWIEVHKYAAVEQIFNGEIGELHGVRFIEDTFAPVLDDAYANKDGGVTYATYLFGKDAFAIVDPEGGALEMIVHNKGDGVGGPLDQFSTLGYKFQTNGATILYEERMLRIMSTTSFSDSDVAN